MSEVSPSGTNVSENCDCVCNKLVGLLVYKTCLISACIFYCDENCIYVINTDSLVHKFMCLPIQVRVCLCMIPGFL